MCCCCGRGGRRLSGPGCHRFESVFLLRYGFNCWIGTLQTERTISEAGELNYLAIGYPLICVFPLTRRFAPRWSAQTKVAKGPSLSFVNVEIYWTCIFKSRIPSHGVHLSFLTHHPFTILLLKPLPQAQTHVQAEGTRTEEQSSPHARPTFASSNPLAALSTGGIMEPPAVQVHRCRQE